MPKNKLRSKRKFIKPSISLGNENEKWRHQKIGLKLIDIERLTDYKMFYDFFFYRYVQGRDSYRLDPTTYSTQE